MAVLVVPKKYTKGTIQGMIRNYLERKFPNDEKIGTVYITPEMKCLVTIGKPCLEFSDMGRLQFHTEEQYLKFDLQVSRVNMVMEG